VIYIKSVVAGAAALIGAVTLLTSALGAIHLAARYLIGHFSFISLPIMLIIFVIGFRWQFGKKKKQERASD
jgi:hypothetical protein